MGFDAVAHGTGEKSKVMETSCPGRDAEDRNAWNLRRLNVPDAWSAAPGEGEGVKVGILDTGIREDPDVEGIEVEDLTPERDGDPMPRGFDRVNHGTAVAGIIAGRINGEGIAGIAPGATVKMYKVFDEGEGSFLNIITRGILAAAADGMNVLNISIASDGEGKSFRLPSAFISSVHTLKQTLALKRAVDLAYRQNMLIVAAAGYRAQEEYPCKFPKVLCVAAQNCSGAPSVFTAGIPHIDERAPGEHLRVAGESGFVEGNSYAAPHVTGLIALAMSCNPDLKNNVGGIQSLLAQSRNGDFIDAAAFLDSAGCLSSGQEPARE